MGLLNRNYIDVNSVDLFPQHVTPAVAS